MRLRKIDTIAEANAFVDSYIVMYNERFAIAPFCDVDAHRSTVGFDLERVLAVCNQRTLSKDCTLQVRRKIWRIGGDDVFPYRKVLTVEQANLTFEVFADNEPCHVTEMAIQHPQAEVVDGKGLNARLDRRPTGYIPAANHPWRTPFRS
ncbi:MAG: hypothetical protein NVSMB64_13160 [Candidatus Velthaea sp.]